MKEIPRENFRWAAHTMGLAVARPKDYELNGDIDATTPYAAWKQLAGEGRALRPGDLLESTTVDGAPEELLIAKYIGFEPAKWFVPEPKPDCSFPSTDPSDAVPFESAVSTDTGGICRKSI